MSDSQREFEIILWGASGFTGRLVADYLYANYGQGNELRWALAGRNQSKLEGIVEEIAGAKDALPIVIADSGDLAAMKAMAARTQVICTAVGPYALYGTNLVAACVEKGTDYCDLTGELQWMKRVIGEYQSEAELSGARIVHTCGFDCIPSDMGVYYLQQQMQQVHGVSAAQIKLRTKAFAGGFSGGTVYSMMNMMDEADSDPEIVTTLADPYALNPPGSHRGEDVNDQTTAIYDEDFTSWTSPFAMAGINTRVVRRSNALMNYAYGEDFRYDEATLSDSSIKARAAALAGNMVMGSMAVTPLRKMAAGLLPAPGEGPSKTKRENGFYEIWLHGRHPNDRSKDLRAIVKGDMDPGYGSTSKMLAECAVCLARDDVEVAGGFWTPASALGNHLLARLQEHAGLSFTLND
ncbi:saccharopine dehydrogenase [marine gamma proteobacterium HTCC2143]|uniref:Saccharopine dehydrogenase n=1 Tax=marine gamma proteobacterium HTCC2143 TaxID=247633 RepID=A0YH74_9GAMM|nr:saccharopine dehydrogenase [marine gamma proteobacterium HTCC2143]